MKKKLAVVAFSGTNCKILNPQHHVRFCGTKLPSVNWTDQQFGVWHAMDVGVLFSNTFCERTCNMPCWCCSCQHSICVGVGTGVGVQLGVQKYHGVACADHHSENDVGMAKQSACSQGFLGKHFQRETMSSQRTDQRSWVQCKNAHSVLNFRPTNLLSSKLTCALASFCSVFLSDAENSCYLVVHNLCQISHRANSLINSNDIHWTVKISCQKGRKFQN